MTDQVAAGAGEPSKAKARGWRLAAFALPGAPLLALSVPPIVFLPPYYIGYLGLDEALVGFLFLAARAVDIFLNPTIGGLQDRTRVAIGRRRAWLIGATPLVMAAVWLAFIGLPANAGSLFAGLAIFSLYATFASAMIAHLSWAGELEPDYNARTKVLGAVQIASSLPILWMQQLRRQSRILYVRSAKTRLEFSSQVPLSLLARLALTCASVLQRKMPNARTRFGSSGDGIFHHGLCHVDCKGS
jgi:hypothetical protein